MNKVIINGNDLTLDDVINVARKFYIVEIAEDAKASIIASRKLVDYLVDNEKVQYGITTGFGKFSDVVISKEETKLLQKNLIMSHACSVGELLHEEIVRAMMLLRVNALVKGFSGIRLSTIDTLIEMLNKKVHPAVPEKGSLGASGDLAPLSHMVLVMIGEGEAFYKGEKFSGYEAMNNAGIPVMPYDFTISLPGPTYAMGKVTWLSRASFLPADVSLSRLIPIIFTPFGPSSRYIFSATGSSARQ